MTEPKGEQTATEMVSKARETASHLDAKGRMIEVKPLNALQIYRLSKVLGPNATPSSTEMATIACMVCKIDTQPVAFPKNEQDVEFLIQQLDFEGIVAAGIALGKLAPSDDKERAARLEAEGEIAKN